MVKLLFLLIFCFASQAVSAQGKLEISQLMGDFYIYTTYSNYQGTPFPANSMYVITPDGAIMIDTPWDTTQVEPLLDSIYARHNKKVIMCVATHFHDDRTGGFEILRRHGIKTYSTQRTLELCRTINNPEAEYTFSKDTIFNAGGIEFETLYPGWGHTEDNIVIWFPGSHVLYGGCFIKSTDATGLGNLADADTKSWEAAAEKVMDKYPDAEYIIPGHQSWLDRGSLKYTLELLKDKNGRVKGKNYKEDQFKDK
jgi:glyoxylase-like metal-dependent hydrolase (beta-lactamase superfamily II)